MPSKKVLATVANTLRKRRWRNYNFGGCHMAAVWVAKHIGGEVVYGCYKLRDQMGPYHKTHLWVIWNGLIVDPTAGQFHGFMAQEYPARTVYIGPPKRSYEAWCTCGGDSDENPEWLLDRALRSSLPKLPLEQLVA